MQDGVPLEIVAPQRHVHALRGEIHRPARRVQMHLHAGMRPLEVRQARDQPHHRDRGLARQHQRRVGGGLPKLRQTGGQLLEQAAGQGQQLTPCIGQENSPIPALKQSQPQCLLQLLDLTADCAMGDKQLFCGPAERLMAGRRIEHAQCAKRGKFHGDR
ncbi:hypothetical protein D3C71_1256630 [compost metagenome]